MLLHHLRQIGDIFIRLLQQQRQSLVLLLVDQLPVSLLILGHQSAHALLLDALLLLLLLALGVGVVDLHGAVQLLQPQLARLVELPELLAVLQDRRQVLLGGGRLSVRCGRGQAGFKLNCET